MAVDNYTKMPWVKERSRIKNAAEEWKIAVAAEKGSPVILLLFFNYQQKNEPRGSQTAKKKDRNLSNPDSKDSESTHQACQ